MANPFLLMGALSCGVAVGLGAFGAHALKDVLSPDALATFETGVRYQFYHSLGILGVALLWFRLQNTRIATLAGWLFLVGIVLFSGSLYLLAITGIRWIGAFTPIGGLAMIAGWVALAFSGLRAVVPVLEP